MNWQEISSTSHHQTAVAVQQELREGNLQEASAGIQELIDALARSERRALKSQLIRLMAHVIKWKEQPERQSRSWAATIHNARDEIADIQGEIPSLNKSVILELWDKCLVAAKREAEAELNRKARVAKLSWKQVFEDPYDIK